MTECIRGYRCRLVLAACLVTAFDLAASQVFAQDDHRCMQAKMTEERLRDQGHFVDDFRRLKQMHSAFSHMPDVAVVLESPKKRDIEAVRSITGAEKLTIKDVAITSGMESAIGTLKSLQTIVIENCTLTENGAQFFASLPGVREIELSQCTFDGNAVQELRHPERLTTLTVIDCQLIEGRLQIPLRAPRLTDVHVFDTPISIDSFQRIVAHPAVEIAEFHGGKNINDNYLKDIEFGASLYTLGLRESSVSHEEWLRLKETYKDVWIDYW